MPPLRPNIFDVVILGGNVAGDAVANRLLKRASN